MLEKTAATKMKNWKAFPVTVNDLLRECEVVVSDDCCLINICPKNGICQPLSTQMADPTLYYLPADQDKIEMK